MTSLRHLPDLRDLKTAREKAKLNQQELAGLSRVGQSLISKAERGDRMPRYDTVKKLFEAIDKYMAEQAEQDGKKAFDIMTREVISFSPDTPIHEVIKCMKTKGISQFPVIVGKVQVGSVTDRGLLGADPKEAIKGYLEETLPVLPQTVAVVALRDILRVFSAVLLTDQNGDIVGIISRENLLGYL